MKVDLIIEEIDKNISKLLKYKNSDKLKNNNELQGWLCDTIAHSYSLECAILMNCKLKLNTYEFFKAQTAVARHYVDWGLDEVADIYNELRKIALKYMDKS